MLPSSMHICTWMCCLGKVTCCFWWGISFFKIFCILMMVIGLEVKQLQPLTAKCHKLPLFCFDDFSPSSKSMKAYKKNSEGSISEKWGQKHEKTCSFNTGHIISFFFCNPILTAVCQIHEDFIWVFCHNIQTSSSIACLFIILNMMMMPYSIWINYNSLHTYIMY